MLGNEMIGRQQPHNPTPQPIRSSIVFITQICAVVAVLVSLANADSGTEGSAPSGKPLATTPYLVRIDARWSDVNGYRPVRVTVRRRGGTTTLDERTVSVEVAPFLWSSYDSESTIEQEITIPEGANEGVATIYLLQNRFYRGCELTVREGGRPIKELNRVSVMLDTNNSNRDYSDAEPNILILDYDAPSIANRDSTTAALRNAVDAGVQVSDRKLPELRPLVSLLPNEYTYAGSVTGGTDLRTLEDLRTWRRLLLLSPHDVTPTWLSLTGMDLAFITLPDLLRMQRDDPQAWGALQNWLAAGGNLSVTQVGERFEQLPAVEAACTLKPLESAPTDEIDYRGWELPAPTNFGTPVTIFQASKQEISQVYSASGDGQTVINAASRAEREAAAARPRPFVLRTLGYGTVVAFASDPFDGDKHQWNWFFNTLTPQRYLWSLRHGMSLRRENPDYWDFMIPNVGTAPVNAFRVLITAFVIAIGPVNFWLLKRAKRLGWLLVTVPAGALAVIMSLFCYAMFTDGFRMQYRVRSISHIDQRRGQVICWSRQSYYGGLTPSGGFHFPIDAVVYPMEQMPTVNSTFGRSGQRRYMKWNTEQILQSGFIAPRVTSQFIVVRSRPSQRGLQVTGGMDTATLKATNRLGTRLKRLYLCDDRQALYAASDVAEGAEATFTKITGAECQAELQKYFRESPLQRPEAFDEQGYRNTISMNQTSYYYMNNAGEQSLQAPLQATGVLERELTRVKTTWPMAPQPRSYVAVVEEDPEVAIGVRSGRARLGFSVIHGEY